MAQGFKSFTTGERRGLLALIIVLAIIVATAYLGSRQSKDNGITQPQADSVKTHVMSGKADSILSIPSGKKLTKKKKKTAKTAIPPVTPRDPLSQPVPQL